MKKHCIIHCLCVVFAVVSIVSTTETADAAFTPKKELGNVMYVGDSITHGVRSGSYRRELFKIFADNGISQKEVGVNKGHYNNYSPGSFIYRGSVFQNIHSSISSERAYEIAGRINTSGRLGNSNIFDWLGLDRTYTGSYKIADGDTPDTFFMMIGTNDLLADHQHISKVFAEKQKNLIGTCTDGIWDGSGDMDTIVKAMRQANPHAQIALTAIPTWAKGRHNNNSEEDLAVTAVYNKNMTDWGKQNDLVVIDINKGITDVAETKFIGAGAAAMFSFDKLHPSAQGDLLIAGNLAKALGYPGRTVGLKRKASNEFRAKKSLKLKEKSTTPYILKPHRKKSSNAPAATNSACTAEFALTSGIGDGAKNGWDISPLLSVSIGNGTVSGTLNISEAYISWGDRILYSVDTSSSLTEPLRIAFVPEDKEQGISGGFCVWLGNMLIGEALPGSTSDFRGVSFTAHSPKPIELKNIGVIWDASFAPL